MGYLKFGSGSQIAVDLWALLKMEVTQEKKKEKGGVFTAKKKDDNGDCLKTQ